MPATLAEKLEVLKGLAVVNRDRAAGSLSKRDYLDLIPALSTGLQENGIPVVQSAMEVYPAQVVITPRQVSGARVLGWAESRNRQGNYPGGIVLCDRGEGYDRYVVWTAYTRDGGVTWYAETGDYLNGLGAAWDRFFERAANHVERGE